MATRKIKNAKDLVTDELIYFKSHAQATFMSDGTTVEDKINGLQNGGGVDLSKYVQKTELSSVATSGNYNDLSNKPTIPSAVTESTVSGWGFTKNTGTYSKPSGGIPKSDLSSVVQTSLGKADTALQSYTEQYKGTVTGVKINGTTKNPSSGVVDLGTVITAHQTLKTINGESIVGSGDIVITGGGIQAVATGDVIDDVNVNYATTAYVDDKVANISLTDYATTAYVDGLVGDINSVLESIISGGVSLITFTVNVAEYQAEEGMTWEQWVNSEYNTSAYYIEYKQVFITGSGYINNVTSSDVILNNGVYVTTGGGGSN